MAWDAEFCLCGTSTEILGLAAVVFSSSLSGLAVFLALPLLTFETVSLAGAPFTGGFGLVDLRGLPFPFLTVGESLLSELLVDLGAEAAASEERVDLVEGAADSTFFFWRFSGAVLEEASPAAALRFEGAMSLCLEEMMAEC